MRTIPGQGYRAYRVYGVAVKELDLSYHILGRW